MVATTHQQVAEKVLNETLDGKPYDEEDAKDWSIAISDAVREGVVALNIPRFKVIVQTVVGQMKDQGIRVASRCLWDVSTDNYATCSYKNVSFPSPVCLPPSHPFHPLTTDH